MLMLGGYMHSHERLLVSYEIWWLLFYGPLGSPGSLY